MVTKPTDAEAAASAALVRVYDWLKRLAAVGGGLGGDADVNALRVVEAQEVIRKGVNDRDLIERQARALAAGPAALRDASCSGENPCRPCRVRLDAAALVEAAQAAAMKEGDHG